MKINFNEYRDKVYACWIGKNIGGTMGTPYEGSRQFNDIKGFVTEEGVILPNDDLDLQLVWLLAVERLGIRSVDSKVLGEFWNSYVSPFWNEYGIGKNNMETGLMPPLSGDAYNDWNNSNGAWIRTEIWASLAPACPEVAMKYAYEDACVDHGTGEGTVAAMFVAALESAAFVVSDIRKLIDIALANIPAESRMAKSIVKLLECYDSGMDYKEARETIRELNSDIGDGWFEAPSNVSYAVIGLLWGEGDFKKSMIYAINCGDDTDCTGATVGSVLGIINGTKGIPEDWKRYIGDGIVTISLKKASIFAPIFPESCTELTERVVRIAPTVPVLFNRDITFTDGPTELGDDELKALYSKPKDDEKNLRAPVNETLTDELVARRPYSVTASSGFIDATLSYGSDPEIKPLESKTLHLRIKNNVYVYGNIPYNMTFRWLGTDGFTVEGPSFAKLRNYDPHSRAVTELDFTVTAPETLMPKSRLVLEIEVMGRPTVTYIPVVFLAK